ncbi:MAG TPA: hypothetical protein VMG08_05910 [Allosphingosinicella sp.]|nr:hypothetical protein [Allosphingosinicella sp.]
MGIWFKDVEDYDNAETATRSGVWGSVGYAVWMAISSAIEFARSDISLQFQLMTPLGQSIIIAFVAVPICVSLVAAWRFRLGKGLIAGSLTLVVLVAQIGLAIANGYFMGILGYAIAFGILMSLINGLRGAWALRAMHRPEEVVQAFE